MRPFALVASLCCIAVAGCSHASSSFVPTANGSSSASALARVGPDAAGFQALYSFGKGGYDSEEPTGAMAAYNNALYGAAHEGGNYGAGTLYKVTTSGNETKLRSFDGKSGAAPYSDLLNVNGTFYGTSYSGGSHKLGTIYSITSGGTYKVLHSFAGSPGDGRNPEGGLVLVNGTFYGTTSGGGSSNEGVAFSMSAKGVTHVLHSFQGGGDGADPLATLTAAGGTLYGTTLSGGTNNEGTAFSMDTSGNEKVLHSFGRGTDGANPVAGMTALNGALYGTTAKGGTGGFGTVFTMSTTGKERVLYGFDGAKNGCHPNGGLVSPNGTLYGTTYGGFAKSSCTSLGTIFKITTGGSLTTLHTFTGKDGSNPYASLTPLGSKLYGTTEYGGAHQFGVFFAINP